MVYTMVYDMYLMFPPLGRTVSAWWPLIHTIPRQQTSLMSKKTWISAGKAFCGMPGHSCSSTVRLSQSGGCSKKKDTLSFLLFSSAPLSPSN